MLTSFQTGTFLESLSQIVGKTPIGAMKMELSVEEVHSIEEATTIMQGTRFSEFSDDNARFPMRGAREVARSLTVGVRSGQRSAVS